MTFDLDTWEERAAIMEFDGGMSRFRSETLAAEAQGVSRYEAIRIRDFERGGDNGVASFDRERTNDLPGMQCGAQTAEPQGQVPQRDVQAGRGGLALSSLPV